MKNNLIGISLLVLADITNAAPVVYTSEVLYMSDLATLGHIMIPLKIQIFQSSAFRTMV